MQTRRIVAILFGLNAAAAPTAEKVPTLKRLAGDMDALRVQVDEARKGLADAAAARQALSDIEARLIQVQAEVERIGAAGGAQTDWQRELAQLEQELTQLSGRVSELWDRTLRETEEERAAKGLVLRTSDGRFETKFGGMTHFRHEFRREVPKGADGETTASTFQLRRAKLSNGGTVWSPNLGYYVQFEFTKDALLDDYYVEYRRWKHAQVRFGQYRVPFDRQRLASATKLQFPDRSTASEAFDLERDVGVMVSGSWHEELIEWQAAVMNGAGENRVNDNIDYRVVTRLVVNPFGPLAMEEGDVAGSPYKLSLGGAVAYNLVPTDIVARDGVDEVFQDQDGNGQVDNVSVVSVGIELAARWQGASFQGEFFRRHEDPGAAGDDRTFNGYYIQAGYFVIPSRLELAARVSWAKPHYFGQTLEQRQSLPEEITEHAFAATYARFGHNLKLQLEYAHIINEGIGAPADAAATSESIDHRVRTQLQIAF